MRIVLKVSSNNEYCDSHSITGRLRNLASGRIPPRSILITARRTGRDWRSKRRAESQTAPASALPEPFTIPTLTLNGRTVDLQPLTPSSPLRGPEPRSGS